jgi:hypothetical protein
LDEPGKGLEADIHNGKFDIDGPRAEPPTAAVKVEAPQEIVLFIVSASPKTSEAATLLLRS